MSQADFGPNQGGVSNRSKMWENRETGKKVLGQR